MTFLSTKTQTYRAQIEQIINDLHGLTIDIGHQNLAQIVNEMRSHIHDPFLFVIVGEVKAGKSSFVNALLSSGKEVCKVAPQPMTDTIQQIMYGEEEHTVEVTPFLKKIYQPVEILKEISIVDTPGTNTIIEKHQEITEGFIPSADLIVFVFEAKNPYRQSAWDFFKFIHTDWQRKVLFVLQQKDLLSPADLEVNINGVAAQAIKYGIAQPIVFSVSAKEEQEEHFDISGFSAVRDYIKANITGGKAAMLKLINSADTCANINGKIMDGLHERKLQSMLDVEFRNDIRATLDAQERKSNNQVKMLLENILAGYDKITRRTEIEVGEELSFITLIKRSVMGIFGSSDNIKVRLDNIKTKFEADLNNEMRDKLQTGITDVADSIQQMAKLVEYKIKGSKTILKHDHEIFSDIADRRANVLKDLQDSFAKFLRGGDNFYDDSLFDQRSSITPNIAAGSGIAIVGIVLAAVAKGAWFDVTGGLLTTVGLVFAGGTAIAKRGQILNNFRLEIARAREQLETETSERLSQYINNIKRKIDLNFTEFDHQLEKETTQINALDTRCNNIKDRLTAIKQEIAE